MTDDLTFFHDDHLTVHVGDCRAVMAAMPAGSVHCVVTSPPYWGLRDYGTPGQLGLEPTPEEYVANMVGVFREVRRVLRDDGTVWLNLGDSYAGGGGFSPNAPSNLAGAKQTTQKGAKEGGIKPQGIIKPKDLVGIPWRVAFALQADGWYLRSDIIWAKPNPMPESVTDRPTKSHEYVFLLSRSPRYFFDADAVREAVAPGNEGSTLGFYPNRAAAASRTASGNEALPIQDQPLRPSARNIRSVWTVATQPYPGAHFATFPEKLVEPCVKAGTSERGVCPECGAPWERETKVEQGERAATINPSRSAIGHATIPRPASSHQPGWRKLAPDLISSTGWRPSCAHAAEPVPGVVLDCFAGSGTVGRVANRLGRRAVLIDLSADYIDQAMLRNAQAPLGLGA